MKKTYILGLMAAVLGFTACSSEDDATLPESKQQGMVLKATVSQAIETRATIDDATDTWVFDFSQGDNIAVNNDEIGAYKSYIFTKGETNFTSLGAKPSATPVNWYAFYPSNFVYLYDQQGTKEDVANSRYALVGATAERTTGEDGLIIDMQPKVAILVIDNQKGSIDINVKNGSNSWVAFLRERFGTGEFELVSNPTKISALTTKAPGLHYIAVPAGVQLSIKDGDNVIKSTGSNGLTAGKYYNLTVVSKTGTTGFTTAVIDGVETPVMWTQLWEGGPKWAEFNVGAETHQAEDPGTRTSWSMDYAPWGENWKRPLRDPNFTDLFESGKCTREWTSINGQNGMLFTGIGDYAENSVFFPANGTGSESGQNVNTYGYYYADDYDEGYPSSVVYGRIMWFDDTEYSLYSDKTNYKNSVRLIVNTDNAH